MYLLLIDLLGVKARWAAGAGEARKALQDFDEIVVDGLTSSEVVPVAGGIDSDAAALVFDELPGALDAARSIYRTCFEHGDPSEGVRYWMRGVVLPTDTAETRVGVALPAPLQDLNRTSYSESMMSAVCVEASGKLKGMRLIVAREAVTQEVRDRMAVKANHGHVVPFRHLDHTSYPEGDWEDFLWMVPDDLDNWAGLETLARNRMRHAGRDLAELDHAAHTRVVFDQVQAILVMQHLR